MPRPSPASFFWWTVVHYPPFLFVEVLPEDEYFARKESRKLYSIYPPEPHPRTAHWEGFPSATWVTLGRNAKYGLLRQLDGGEKHMDALQELNNYFSEMRNATSIIVALFAGIGAAMLAIPGIEKSHWTTRAFFFGAILFAIGGVLIGAISQTLFNLFFGEDIYVHSNHIRNEHNMLTWKNHRRLLLRIWDIFSFQTESIIWSSLFLIAGIITFVITADFSADATSTSKQPTRALFVALSIGPFIINLLGFWNIMTALSIKHRRARDEMEYDNGMRTTLRRES